MVDGWVVTLLGVPVAVVFDPVVFDPVVMDPAPVVTALVEDTGAPVPLVTLEVLLPGATLDAPLLAELLVVSPESPSLGPSSEEQANENTKPAHTAQTFGRTRTQDMGRS